MQNCGLHVCGSLSRDTAPDLHTQATVSGVSLLDLGVAARRNTTHTSQLMLVYPPTSIIHLPACVSRFIALVCCARAPNNTYLRAHALARVSLYRLCWPARYIRPPEWVSTLLSKNYNHWTAFATGLAVYRSRDKGLVGSVSSLAR